MDTTDSLSTSHGIVPSNENPPSDDPPALASTRRVRLARYDQYFNQKKFTNALRKTSKPIIQKKLSKKKPILVVRRVIDSRGQHSSTEIDIMSETLCEILMEINRDVSGLELTRSKPVADPKVFFHSRTGLSNRLKEEGKKSTPDSGILEDLETALQYIEEDHGGTIADFDKLTSIGEITYGLLWALFAPNTLVYQYHHHTEQDQVLLVRKLAYVSRQGRHFAELSCELITNDGRAFGFARQTLEINLFPGTHKILDLPVYPLDSHSHTAHLRERAIRRGRKFATLHRQCFDIEGPALGERDNVSGDGRIYKFNTHGRVMIDPAAFRVFCPNSPLNPSVFRSTDRSTLTDEECLICTPVVLGFCFGTKMWGGFALDRLKDIVWSDESFKRLVLAETQKQLVLALVKQHSTHGTKFDDIVVGKGKGLIGLLCGNPGCGKTLTAEAVAETARRPLYVVSAGELGTEPARLDKQLERILSLASLWDAVLLLDEADVFLQARSSTDVARNALVSIFLRQLEYYQGILILTTNMVEQFDPAFESRMHFCLQYPDLDFDSRKTIWKTFLEKALDSIKDVSEKDLRRISEYKLNGRQIKNAVSSAQSIALSKGSRLLVEHIDTVLEVLNKQSFSSMERPRASPALQIMGPNGDLQILGYGNQWRPDPAVMQRLPLLLTLRQIAYCFAALGFSFLLGYLF